MRPDGGDGPGDPGGGDGGGGGHGHPRGNVYSRLGPRNSDGAFTRLRSRSPQRRRRSASSSSSRSSRGGAGRGGGGRGGWVGGRPPPRSAVSVATTHTGVVVTYDRGQSVGFIRSDSPLPDGYPEGKDVYFRRDFVCGQAAAIPDDLRGWKVAFGLHKFKEKARASAVELRESPAGGGASAVERRRPSEMDGWKVGEINVRPSRKDKGKTEMWVKLPSGAEFLLYGDKMSRYSLLPREGDKVSIQLRMNKENRPRIQAVKTLEFKPRDKRELEDFFRELLKALDSLEHANRATLEMVKEDELWRFLGDQQHHCLALVKVATKMLKIYRGATSGDGGGGISALITAIADTGFPNNVACTLTQDDSSHSEGSRSREEVAEFLKEAIKAAPHCLLPLTPLFSALQMTPDPVLDALLKQLFLQLAVRSDKFDTNHWKTVAPAPQWKEILGSPLHEDNMLREVSTESFYSDPDEYMETYYRLTRAELFSAIQKGIKDLLKGCLDSRDMDHYTHVTVAAVDASPAGIRLGLTFRTEKPVRNWETSAKLMFGNLLCISPNQRFDDVIWAAISHRDPQLLKEKRMVFVELCDFNNQSQADVVSRLLSNGDKTLMVESPTYFKSLWPVLSSLRQFDVEDFRLGERFIQGDFDMDPPQYTLLPEPSIDLEGNDGENFENTAHTTRFHLGALLSGDGQTGDKGNDTYQSAVKIHEGSAKTVNLCREMLLKEFDNAQQDAFNFCLDNDLAIVQGPPGCGKTFLGVKLVQTILNWRLDRPILVMTYKNHALDEFLKHCSQLPNCDLRDIVRIGNRSKEEALDRCNLAALVKGEEDQAALKSRIIAKSIFEVREELRSCNEHLVQNMKKLVEEDTLLTYYSFLKGLTESQLELFVLHADWKSIGYKIGQQTLAVADWIANRVLPKIRKDFGTLSDFFDACYHNQVKDEGMAHHCYGLFMTVLTKWMPSKQEIHAFKLLDDRFSSSMENPAEHTTEEDADDLDADHVNEVQERRQMAGDPAVKKLASLLKEATFFERPKADTIYELSDFPTHMTANPGLLQADNLWALSKAQKIQLLYTLIIDRAQDTIVNLHEEFSKAEELLKVKARLELDKKVAVVRKKKIIGVTITGASINHDLLHLIAPRVVIVEEAAEILESSLVSALHPQVEHLILIGDHKQLRPQVDTYDLVKKYDFDVSLMERLIRSGAPFKMLRTQNRMRPEFSALLHDIYPDLLDNIDRVAQNLAPQCLKQSMFFWSHNFTEDNFGDKEDRSKRNTKEAKMVMFLALFLLRQGLQPSQITILAAYLGQQKVLRTLQKELQAKYSHLFVSNGSSESIQIQTIDMYQGDENDIVLISLTRSNPAGAIGFLRTMNRRCVAQSRARRGMYFVGNADTFKAAEKGASVWQHLISSMEDQGCVGEEIQIQCAKHKLSSRRAVRVTSDLMNFVENPEQLCMATCGELFLCQISSHACRKFCNPPHSHSKCHTRIEEVRPNCGHAATRRCYEDLSQIPCEVRIPHKFERCGHEAMKKCYVSVSTLRCQVPCAETMSCKLHKCPAKCGDLRHSHEGCLVEVKFAFSACGHQSTKKCSMPETRLKCKEMVSKQLVKCGHTMEDFCFKKMEEIICTHQCNLPMRCNVPGHFCASKCGSGHNHDTCSQKIRYEFPGCGHPSPWRKRCSEPITWKCNARIKGKAPCGHMVEKECWQSIETAFCPEMCTKTRSCQHPCTNRCGEPCDKGTCDPCEEARRKELQEYKRRAAQKRSELIALQRSGHQNFRKWEIGDKPETSAEYLEVKDRVLKYTKEMHNWSPKITKIEKVANTALQVHFENAKTKLFGQHERQLFHGTSNEGVEGIITQGFRMPGPPKFGQKPGMYGQGIYFATDSSKSAQEIYTKGSHKLLLCNVLLGKSKEVKLADNFITLKSLKRQGFDSVFAPRGSAVQNDEFVIFHPAQALPVYIIHYTTTGGLLIGRHLSSNKSFEVIKLQPSRTFVPDDPKDVQFRVAESQFRKMIDMKRRQQGHAGVAQNFEIKSIDFVYNATLEAKFEAKKAEFGQKGIPNHVVLAFHGTAVGNIQNILRINLDPNLHSRQAHGPGSYFSEYPDVSLGYGEGLILFKTLPGKEYHGTNSSWPYHNSKTVQPHLTKGYGDMLIINDPDQFMPYFVYHLERN